MDGLFCIMMTEHSALVDRDLTHTKQDGWADPELMLGQRRRRCTKIEPAQVIASCLQGYVIHRPIWQQSFLTYRAANKTIKTAACQGRVYFTADFGGFRIWVIFDRNRKSRYQPTSIVATLLDINLQQFDSRAD